MRRNTSPSLPFAFLHRMTLLLFSFLLFFLLFLSFFSAFFHFFDIFEMYVKPPGFIFVIGRISEGDPLVFGGIYAFL